MSHRHRDFERIHTEFTKYYKDSAKGDREYYDWLHTLNLDETREYGAARESFQWAKHMISLLKEDADHKYYQILLGFPTTSMNGNVYRERDLIAAALDLKGKSPSLNHKDEFWFSKENPRNHWGILSVVDAKYEDGAVETILQVPKTAICPVCNGEKMTELIDKKKIVNVSLEGRCARGYGGECEGFQFTDPPFTLLTVDTLPGIPLARIKPLESIMVEALQVSTKTKQGEKRMKIKAKVKEETREPQTMGQTQPSDEETTLNTMVYDDPMKHSTLGPSGLKLKGTIVHTNATTALGTPATPDSYRMVSGPEYARNVSHEDFVKQAVGKGHLKVGEPCSPELKSCVDALIADGKPEDSAWAICRSKIGEARGPLTVPASDEPVLIQPGAEMPKADTHERPSRTSPPDTHIVTPDSAPNALPNPTQYAKGYVGLPAYPKTIMGTSPAEALPSLEERKARIQAELKAKSAEEQAIVWEQKHNEVYEKLTNLKGQYEGLKVAFDKLNERSIASETDRKEAQLKYESQCGLVTDLKTQLDRTTSSLNEVTEKYNKSLKQLLEINEKWTKADEDYLSMAKQNEDLADKLQEARDKAKKIVRIKA